MDSLITEVLEDESVSTVTAYPSADGRLRKPQTQLVGELDSSIDLGDSEGVNPVVVSADEQMLFNNCDYVDALCNLHVLPRRRKAGILQLLVAKTKGKFLLDRYTRANVLVVRKYLYTEMCSIGMRPLHITQILDAAVELCFTPSRYEIEARELRTSRAVLDRLEERDGPRYTRWFESITSLFPRKRHLRRPEET